jgi:hypothetical protein
MGECHFRAIGSGYGCSCCAMQDVTLSQSCDLLCVTTLDLACEPEAGIDTWELSW